jgi:hypothetical protein
MKIFLSLIANALILTSTLQAQKPKTAIKAEVPYVSESTQKLKVAEKPEFLGGAKHNALWISIYDADEKTIDKDWKSLLKKYNGKLATLNGEQFADNAVIKEISNNTIDIYWKLERGIDNSSKLIAAYDLGGAYLSAQTHPKEYRIVETIMYDFAQELSRRTIANQLKEAQREAEKRDKKLKSLISANEEMHKDIEGYKAKIKIAEENIVVNVASQKEAKSALDAQNKILEEVKLKARKYE